MDNNNKKVTLKDFIKDNYPLLTVLGVFVGLFSFLNMIEFPDSTVIIKPFLQALIYVNILVIAFEIWKNFPSSKENIVETMLNIFEQSFITFVTIFLIFGLYIFRNVLKLLLSVILFFVYGVVGNFLIKKFKIYKKVDEFANKYSGSRSTIIRGLFFYIFLGIIILLDVLTVILLSIFFPKFMTIQIK